MTVLKKMKTGVTAVWGTPTTPTAVSGTLTDLSVKRTAEKEPLPDNNGETIGKAYYDARHDVSLDVIMDDSAGVPEPGDDLEVEGITIDVDEAEEKWSYKGWKKISVNGQAHDAMATGGALSSLKSRLEAIRAKVRKTAPQVMAAVGHGN